MGKDDKKGVKGVKNIAGKVLKSAGKVLKMIGPIMGVLSAVLDAFKPAARLVNSNGRTRR